MGKINVENGIKVIINEKLNSLKETFGILKLKRTTGEILREIDKEDWNK